MGMKLKESKEVLEEGNRMDENRKKIKVSENPELIKSILEPLGFTDICRNSENTGKDKAKIGYDFKARKDGNGVTIEVKAKTFDKKGKTKGIPNAVGTEFYNVEIGRSPKFKANYLPVIGLETKLKKYIPEIAYLVPNKGVNKYKHSIKPAVVFASELKTRLRNTKASDYDGIKVIGNNGGKWEEKI
jgi:hypothetical protein